MYHSAPITKRNFTPGELIEIDGIHEYVNEFTEMNIDSFDDKFGDYLSAEQLAREFFVSTGTVNSWIKKKKITPTAALPSEAETYIFSVLRMQPLSAGNSIFLFTMILQYTEISLTSLKKEIILYHTRCRL